MLKLLALNEVRLKSKEPTKQSGKVMPIPTLILLLFYFWLEPQNEVCHVTKHSIVDRSREAI